MLHCPVGTIQSRLSRGRQRLRRRLERRGLGSALALAGRGPLASPIALGVPQTLAQKVVWAAVSVAGGESIRGLAPAAVIGLVGSELRRHLLARILTVVGTLWVAALVVAGVAMLTGGQLEKNRELQKATTNPSPRANSDPVHVRVVESRLLVANRQSGSSCVIDPRTRCVLAEHDVGCGLADIVALPDDRHVLAVDQAGHDILVLNAHADVIQVLARVQVSPDPVRIVVPSDGSSCVVASRWSRRLTFLELIRGRSPADEPSLKITVEPWWSPIRCSTPWRGARSTICIGDF